MARKLCKGDLMDFKKIELSDQEIIKPFIQQEKFNISDISFANLFLWKNAREIAYCIIEDCLVIQTTYTGKRPYYFFPIGSGNKLLASQTLLEFCRSKQETLEFHSLESASLDFLKTHFKLEFFLNRDRSDYVYSIAELIALAGRKYHKKKNHLNKFLQTYPDYVYEPISVHNAEEIIATYELWFNQNSNITLGLQNEKNGISDALRHWNMLDLQGGVIRVENKIVAFSFGERINEEMAVIHIEKADPNISGAYQIINQQLLKNAFADLKYANREEDLGIEGLRRAKMSYNPVFLVDKYEAVIQN